MGEGMVRRCLGIAGMEMIMITYQTEIVQDYQENRHRRSLPLSFYDSVNMSPLWLARSSKRLFPY